MARKHIIKQDGTLNYDAIGGFVERMDGHDMALATNTASLAEKAKFVSYTMYGAKLNGVDDDTDAVKACHDYANANNLKVIQNHGTIYLKTANATDKRISVKTSTDLTGASIKFDNTFTNSYVGYYVDSDFAPVTVNPSSIQADLVEDTRYIPSLQSYKNTLFVVTSNELFGYRGGDNTQPIYKSDVFTIIDNGYLIDGVLQHSFTSGTIQLFGYSTLDAPITLTGFKPVINTDNALQLGRMVEIQRSNVTIEKVNPIITSMPDINSGTYNFKNTLIHAQYCYNLTVKEVQGENLSALSDISTDTVQGQYIFASAYVSKLKIDNCVWVRGWGAMNTQNTKDVSVYDSILNRIDAHWGLGNLYAQNIKIVGNNSALLIGWGKGKVLVNGLEYIVTDKLTVPNTEYTEITQNTIIELRSDIGTVYEGDITVKDIKYVFTKNLSQACVVHVGIPTWVSSCYRNIKFPKLHVENIHLKQENNAVVTTLAVFNGYIPSGLSKTFTSQPVTIKNMTGDIGLATTLNLIYLADNSNIITSNYDFVLDGLEGLLSIPSITSKLRVKGNKCILHQINTSIAPILLLNNCTCDFILNGSNNASVIKMGNSQLINCLISPSSYLGSVVPVSIDAATTNTLFQGNIITDLTNQTQSVVNSLFQSIPSTMATPSSIGVKANIRYNTDLLSAFPASSVEYNEVFSDHATGFPSNLPGLLITCTTGATVDSYQIYHPRGSVSEYKRIWVDDTTHWGAWTKVSAV